MIISCPEYYAVMNHIADKLPEYVEPVYTDDQRTALKEPVALQSDMADYPRLLPADGESDRVHRAVEVSLRVAVPGLSSPIVRAGHGPSGRRHDRRAGGRPDWRRVGAGGEGNISFHCRKSRTFACADGCLTR